MKLLVPGKWASLPLLVAGCVLLAAGPSAGTAPDADRAATPTVRLVFVGDIMLADLPGQAVARGKDPFAPFASIFREADITVGNLECVIATTGEPIEDKPWTFRAHPRCVKLLAGYFDALSLANNHTGDFGPKAFIEQLDLLRGRTAVFGGGRNVAQARTPLILKRRGLRIALLGYNEFHPREFEAGPTTPGVAWLVEEQALADIAAARSRHKADLVIPVLHWGRETRTEPSRRQRSLARKMIDAGADVVVGGHPHVTQGAEYYKGRLIVYSLGNFVFDGFDTEETLTGWILRLTMSKHGLVEWDTLASRIDEQGLPHPAPQAATPFGKAGTKEIGLRAAK